MGKYNRFFFSPYIFLIILHGLRKHYNPVLCASKIAEEEIIKTII